MKSLVLPVLAFGLVFSLYSNSASALVRMVEACRTPTGIKVSITDNQGIGPVRDSHFFATVYDQNDIVLASYEVALPQPHLQSVSFGRSAYTDVTTQGQNFSLAFPSTNFQHTSLLVVLPNKLVYKSDELACQNY